MLCFLILSVAVHGVPKNILDFVHFLIIIFSFNSVQSVIPNFLFRYSLEWGGVNANHNATHSLSLAGKNKTENDFRLLKNSDGLRDDEWNFCRGQEQTLLYFSNARDKNEKVQKIFEEN